jgi:hypothetical protein
MDVGKAVHVCGVSSNMYHGWGWNRLCVVINLISRTAAAFQRPRCPAPLVQSNGWCGMLLHLMQTRGSVRVPAWREPRSNLRSVFVLPFAYADVTDSTFTHFISLRRRPVFYGLQKLRTSETMICPTAYILPVSHCTVRIKSNRPSIFINSTMFKACMWC